MIYFAVDEIRTALLDHYLASQWGAQFRGRISQIAYPQLFRARTLARGAWIFTSLDALSEAELRIVHRAQCAARDAGLPVLNPAHDALRRYDFLGVLHNKGLNDFRAFHATANLAGLRFPVFVRVENEHDGSLTPLLYNRAQLARAMAYLWMRGLAREELLVVEFCETVSADALYRKYSVLRIGDAYIPRYLHIGPHWMTKNGTRDGDDRLIDEEIAYLRENPHAEWVRKVFELAHIEYGRLDYGVRGSRPQAWEINFTPFLAADPSRPTGTPQRERLRRLTRPTREHAHRAMGEAFQRLDPGPTAGDPVGFEIPPALEAEARRERETMRALARRHARVAKWAAAPGVRAVGPALRRMLRWSGGQ